MKKLIAALISALMLVGMFSTPASAAVTPDGYIDWNTSACNSGYSLHRVLVAQHRSGAGDQWYLNSGQCSGRDTDSVYVYYTKSTTGNLCTSINGTAYTSRGWVNTAWWRTITIKVYRC